MQLSDYCVDVVRAVLEVFNFESELFKSQLKILFESFKLYLHILAKIVHLADELLFKVDHFCSESGFVSVCLCREFEVESF